MRHPLGLLLVLGLISCGSDAVVPFPPPPPPPPPPMPPPPPGSRLLIRGGDMSGSTQRVSVTFNGTPVSGATVHVNNLALGYLGGGSYYGALTPAVAAGGRLTFSLTVGTLRVDAEGLVPATPGLGLATAVNRGTPINVWWVTPTSPDSFVVGLRYYEGEELREIPVQVRGDAREADVPTEGLPLGATNFQIFLYAVNHGAFSGDTMPGSSMHIRSSAGPRPYAFEASARAVSRWGLAR